MAMDILPQEVVDQIASNLYRPDLKNLLLLSPKLRTAAEKYSDGFTDVKLQVRDLREFENRFRGPRFRWLRKLEYTLVLLSHPPSSETSSTTDDIAETNRNEEYLSSQIHRLFNCLRTLHDKDGPQGTIDLTITSPETSEKDQTRIPEAWFIRVLRPGRLPTLNCIGSLHLGPSPTHRQSDYFSRFDLRTILDLSTKLPGIRSISAELFDEHNCDAEIDQLRVRGREDFAKLASNTSLQTTTAELRFQGRKSHQLLDHEAAMPKLIRSRSSDPFSSSLRLLCQNLTQLRLSAIIDQSFFWPEDNEGTVWPNMESLEVKFHPVTPSGSWYFMGPRGEGKDVQGYPVQGVEYSSQGQPEENDTIVFGHAPCRPSGWRLQPNPQTLYPLLIAFAKSAAKMPRLKEAMIWSPIWWYLGSHVSDKFSYNKGFDMMNSQRSLGWGIGYTAPDSDGADDEDVRLFEWRTGSWEANDTLKQLFHEIGREEYGDEFDDDWDPDANQEDLFFEDFCRGQGNL
ncbi:hypothetical protein CORC01_06309 [Colletotrichum orchidophilum]|uniref:F-box domain-containing protein n=1 Tax=Colletotrichum orchidophilum TaxID=1209926 RepID=A0A1G4BA95_9PEZI|nr:uncharacterized protein CORC01_06309 [Colletotrichum orchidophilum]OHE98313.1 hypothetical protein CORC01_06309 [Colletotrichum orchidophilum]